MGIIYKVTCPRGQGTGLAKKLGSQKHTAHKSDLRTRKDTNHRQYVAMARGVVQREFTLGN
jgi:hypothetical protein